MQEAAGQAAGRPSCGWPKGRKAVKGAGTAVTVTARDQPREQPGAGPAGRGREVRINHNAPWANGRRREGSLDRRTKADCDEESISASWEFAGLGFR